MKIERRKISELKNDPANARKHSPRNLKAIRESLDVFGQQKPIVVDSRGVVIAGNGTLEAARELGWDDINVTVTDLDPAHAQAFGIADNRTAELAEWDTDVLGQLLEGMDSDLADILSIDDLELPDSIDGGEQGEGLTDPDEVPEPPEEPITQTGDLWLLGEHRLLCGDSTSAEDVGRLMDGGKADMVFTDPPYSIGLSSTGLDISNSDKQNMKHFFNAISLNLFKFNLGHWYLCTDWRTYPFLFDLLGNKTKIKNCIIWDFEWIKAGSQYRFTHEFIIFGDQGNKKQVPRECADVWRIKPVNFTTGRLHGAQKPVELIEKAICNSSKDKDVVLDFFSGSGSSLIACEKTKRICCAMELDPKYCDVIVKRWEEFTGKTATRENERT